MPETNTKLENFLSELGAGFLNWEAYLGLGDEQGDAMLSMLEQGVLSDKKSGNHTINVKVAKMNIAAKDLRYGPNSIPVYFTNKKQARQVTRFYEENRETIGIVRH